MPAFLTGQLERVPDSPQDDAVEVDQDVLATLIDLGVAPEDARRAILDDRVALVMSQQVLDDAPRFSLADLAKKSGVDADTILMIRSALGLPQEPAFTKLDLDWVKQVAVLLEVLSLEAVVRSARSRGSALAAIAMSDMGVIRDELIVPLRQAGADDLTIGIALAEATKAIMPVSHKLLLSTYTLQLRHILTTELAATATREGNAEFKAAVAFVDIVGFTRLSARIDPSGLDALIEAFEQRVMDVISDRRDVAVVKYLGDAVMLVAPDAVTMTDALLELCQEVESLAESPVRAGMAAGNVLARDGDYFGPVVNLAARLTDIARPWRVLVAEDLISELREDYRVDRIRPLRLRGIGTSRPGSVRGPLLDDEHLLATVQEAQPDQPWAGGDSTDS